MALIIPDWRLRRTGIFKSYLSNKKPLRQKIFKLNENIKLYLEEFVAIRSSHVDINGTYREKQYVLTMEDSVLKNKEKEERLWLEKQIKEEITNKQNDTSGLD